MKLTKFEHACVLVEDDGGRVLIDPGTFSHGFEDLTDLDAVLITHQHADHVDLERLAPLLTRNPSAAVVTDAETSALLADAGISAQVVHESDRLDVGLTIDVHGSEHAVIHRDVPIVANVGYLVGGRFFHPGDALTVPPVGIEVLGLPTAAPWLKISETVDYLRAVAPRVAVPIHESLLADPSMYVARFEQLRPEGTDVQFLAPGAEWTT